MRTLLIARARRTAHAKPAVEAIVDTIRAHPELDVVTLGPLTNVARALAAAPAIVGRIGRLDHG